MIFTLASIGCGLAPSIGWIIAGRVVQGIGGAMLVPGGMSIIGAPFSDEYVARPSEPGLPSPR